MRYEYLSELPPADCFSCWGRAAEAVAEDRIDLLDTMSRALLSNTGAKQYSDLISFAFFCRRSNIKKKIDESLGSGQSRRGVGTLFHITPNNIPMNFALSFIFGLLSGNSNIVKAPLKKYEQARIFVSTWQKITEGSNFSDLNWFIDFSRADLNIRQYVACSDGLLVWGGDQAVQEIRKFDRKATAISWEFPDRYSAALIDATSVLSCSPSDLIRLAENLFNDTLLVDQNACSSPSIFIWIGSSDDVEKAKVVLWGEFSKIVETRGKVIDDGLKSLRAIELAKIRQLDPTAKIERDWYQNICFVWLNKLSSMDLEVVRPKYGLFVETRINDIVELRSNPSLFGLKLQTMSIFGVDASDIKALMIQDFRGCDRIPAIGRALDFSLSWDGRNSITQLSKLIE
jgi:hypothetical protein